MPISQITIDTAGQVEVNPRIVKVVCDDSLATVTAAGFLNNAQLAAFGGIRDTDMVLVSFASGVSFFEPLFNGNVITLSASALIPDGSITTSKIADLAITAPKMAANSVTAGAMAANSVTTAAVAANAITTNAITDLAVTGAKIAANAITSNTIADGNVTLSKLSAGISPVYVTKFAGKFSYGGGSATVTITGLTGITASAIAFAALSSSQNAVSVQKVSPGTDQIVVTFSGDPGASTIISYNAMVAAS